MIAFSRAEITRLNMAAGKRMAQDGRLGPDALQVGEREFRVGDRIVCGRNARARLGVVNGTRGQVTALDPDQRALTITTDEGGDPTGLVCGRPRPRQPTVGGSWLCHHRAQDPGADR
jgi:ATP-dependent exoDNAse (exonuclease V) alpha subunit